MNKVISPEDNLVTKNTLNYLEYAPVVNLTLVNDKEESTSCSLKIYADKKMRKSIVNNILQGKLKIDVNDDMVTLTAKRFVKIKTGVRGDDSKPVNIKRVEVSASAITAFASRPQGTQRTAKEQADFLFGMLIDKVGGVEWIKEQAWMARGADILHNNNKGNVAYTRLDIMLNRCLRIYNQFKDENKKSEGTAE